MLKVPLISKLNGNHLIRKDEKFVVVVVLPSAVFAVVVGFTFVFVLATIAEVASIANAKV
jgi:hypothetical protein